MAALQMRASGRWLALVLMAGLSGCVRYTGIDHQDTPLNLPASVADTEFTAWPATDWWTEYRDPALTDLIEHALADSPNIQRAEARVRAAQAAAGLIGSSLRPQVSAGFDSTWQRYSENSLMPQAIGGTHDSDNRLAFDLSYELDLFGRHRAQHEVTLALSNVDQLRAQVARLGVASAVAQVYFKLAATCAEREVVTATIAQRAHILELVKARVALGLDSNVERLQAEGAIPRLQEQVEELGERAALLRSALSRLALVPAAITATITPQLTQLPSPVLPAIISSDLLGRRADIVAAQWQIQALLHGIKSVRAEFYPSVNLAAFAGFSALGLGALLEGGSQIYGLAPAIRLPIFDANRLRSKLKFVNAQTDVAIADYNIILLDAMQEVVHAVTSLRALIRRTAAQQQAQVAAEKAYAIALQRFEAGLTGYLTVLATESEVLSERRVATALAARGLELDVALKRALGGGLDTSALLITGNRL